MSRFLLWFLIAILSPVGGAQEKTAPEAAADVSVAGKSEENEETPAMRPGDWSLAPDAKYGSDVFNVDAIKAEESALVEVSAFELGKQKPPRVEIIVDSSGSMGQNLSLDRTKMYFMKKILLRYFTDQYKVKAETALRVYGSRRKGDCTDNELMVNFAEKSLGAIETKVAQLSPVGRTPLYQSVRDAANDLKTFDGPRAIVLFTDGEDTCGGNPCKEGKLAADDPILATQIFIVGIGFAPNSEELKKISCLGETKVANNEEELFSALGEFNQKIYSDKINLKVVSPDPLSQVQLFHLVDDKWAHFRTFTATFGTTVPPGKYQAVVNLNPPYKFDTFTVPPKRAVTLTVRGTGNATVEFLDRILDVELLDKHMKPVHKFKSDVREKAPIGRWTMKIYKQPFYEKFVPRFDIYPNGEFNYKVSGAGAVRVNSPGIVGLYVYDHKNKLLGNYLTNASFALPAGEYKIHVDEKCSFDKVNVKDDGILNVLSCK